MTLTLPLVFVGMPGSGKTKVGRLVAQALGVGHIDTDALVEVRTGRSVSDIFAHDGEAVFRQAEADAVECALRSGGVISLGGGAVTSARVRELLAHHSVVYIDVEHDELLRRVTQKNHRPLLRDDPDGALRRLRAERGDLYEAVATHTEASDDGPATEVAQRIVARCASVPIIVKVGGDRPYPVIISTGVQAAHILGGLRPTCTKILLIHARSVTDSAERLADELTAAGMEVRTEYHPDAEEAKTIDVVAQMWNVAGQMRLGRHDAIVALGGGATTDMAGFVAATWLRGIDVVQIPTTLLAMVDAAVGGKTGINTAAGKNLVGSFHTPTRVLVDPSYLSTLPDADLRAGAAEIVKAGFIRDREILRLVEQHGPQALRHDGEVLRELITRAVQVKATVVSADLQESGLREILNYGHTLAHAIERCENYRWRHGDAVAVGCVFAAEIAHTLGLLDSAAVDLHRQLFAAIGLPTSYSGASMADLLHVMSTDKKVRVGRLRFVLLEGITHPVVRTLTPEDLTEAARRVGIND
ncbi:3-dehydroquinate synthase [Schaalia suimastitidis]|uniref:3-dehydroquinate synthase n=1 Tax=Schaalia suimastitidis TaxID=121163 RepID=UPI0003FD5D8E|nr:3-dehydroquinate synthase [Schaalia suimastitidis]